MKPVAVSSIVDSNVEEKPPWRFPNLMHGLRDAVSLAFDERRLLVALPCFAILGLIGYRILPNSPHPGALIAVLFMLIAGVVAFRRQLSMLRVFVAGLGIWIGFCLLAVHGALFGTPMLIFPVFGTYEAVVDRVLSTDEEASRLIISKIVPLEDARDVPVKRARLFVRNAPDISRGDTIRGRMRLASVPGPVVPGGFDSQFHGYFDGIGAFGNATGQLEVVEKGDASFRRLVEQARFGIGARIDAVLPQPASGIARALTIGDQTQISDETREIMAVAGIAHILAISGLHLTLVAGGVFVGIRMLLALSYSLGQRVSVKKIAAVGGIVAAVVYLILSGGSVSAVRATIMLTLVFGAVLAGRRALTMRNVALAATFVIITDPASIFRPSFQLSFAAVVALVGVYEVWHRRREKDIGVFRQFLVFFGGLAMTSVIAGVATALFAAYHFQQTAPLGVLGNLFALPLVSFIVLPAAFTAVLMMPFSLEAPFLKLMGWCTDHILTLAIIIDNWSENISGSPLLTPMALVFGFFGLFWFAVLTNRYRFIGPTLMVPFIILFGRDVPPDVLIADSTQAVAVRVDGSRMALIGGRIGSFATNAWSETYQVSIEAKYDGLMCDNAGCIANNDQGFTIALVKHGDAFSEDCAVADLVITRLTVPGFCRELGQVIDITDLRRGGMHWLRWHADEARFEPRPAITDTNRPWRAVR